MTTRLLSLATLIAVPVLCVGCGSTEPAPPSSPPTTTATPTSTTSAADAATTRAACSSFDQAMHWTVDMVNIVNRGESMPTTLMSQAAEESKAGVDTAAALAPGATHDAMGKTSAALAVLDAKIKAWRSGDLSLSTELTAVYEAIVPVVASCSGVGSPVTNQIPTGGVRPTG